MWCAASFFFCLNHDFDKIKKITSKMGIVNLV